jgi:Dna[CI] antecedent, DciA
MNSASDSLAKLQKNKQTDSVVGAALGPEMLAFFKETVQRRQTKLAKIAEVWGALVPEMFCEHCSLDALVRGTLTVSVDSSGHLYELRQLLLSGLQEQILLACKSAGLRKIVLRAGNSNA